MLTFYTRQTQAAPAPALGIALGHIFFIQTHPEAEADARAVALGHQHQLLAGRHRDAALQVLHGLQHKQTMA